MIISHKYNTLNKNIIIYNQKIIKYKMILINKNAII